ncbi:MAG: hypothetical protein LH603_12505 [Pseudonocardia sp.]|nr:hypothetical protein [Pseudonocardia sp.]
MKFAVEIPVPDVVDRVVRDWATEIPGLPVGPIEIVARIGRLRSCLDDELTGLSPASTCRPPTSRSSRHYVARVRPTDCPGAH